MKTLLQFIKFGIVGISNTAVGYLLNIGTIKLLEPWNVRWDYIVGNILSFILSVLWSYYWNNKFVFTIDEGETRNHLKALGKTYLVYGFTGIILNNVMSFLWINILLISKYLVPLINSAIGVPINFFIQKLWAYKK